MHILIQLWISAWLKLPLSVSWLCGRVSSNEWLRMCNDNGFIGNVCCCDTFGWTFGVINVCKVPWTPSIVRNFKSTRFLSSWQRYVASKWLPSYRRLVFVYLFARNSKITKVYTFGSHLLKLTTAVLFSTSSNSIATLLCSKTNSIGAGISIVSVYDASTFDKTIWKWIIRFSPEREKKSGIP